MTPFDTPEPSKSVTCALAFELGALWLLVVRGDNVTFDPLDDVYTINILELAIALPWPSATHS